MLLLDALACRNQSRPPVWLMRQAGRYMPEYRKLRQQHDFLDLCHCPELAAEVTLLPIHAFGMDAAILFSDILVVAEGLGFTVTFEESSGPHISPVLETTKQVDEIVVPNANEAFQYVADSIKLIKPSLKVPLLGFCGAPFTIASYLIEGRTSRDHKKTKQWLFRDPASFHKLLDKIADCSIDYLKLQIAAGVDAVQIFDSWASALAYPQFKEFSWYYLDKICKGLKSTGIPIILFCKGSSVFAPDLSKIDASAVSLDWNCDLKQMRARIPTNVALQGNLDPCVLYAHSKTIKHTVRKLLQDMKGDPGYIFNLGHGILPDMSPEAVKVLVETVQEGV